MPVDVVPSRVRVMAMAFLLSPTRSALLWMPTERDCGTEVTGVINTAGVAVNARGNVTMAVVGVFAADGVIDAEPHWMIG